VVVTPTFQKVRWWARWVWGLGCVGSVWVYGGWCREACDVSTLVLLW
jgi:hypothetical protein